MADVRMYSDEERAEIIRRYFESGMTVPEFARSPECPVHLATLYRWLKEHARARAQQSPEPETVDSPTPPAHVSNDSPEPDEDRFQVVSSHHDPLWSMLERSRDEVVEDALPRPPKTVPAEVPERIPEEKPAHMSLAIPETVRRLVWAATGVAVSAVIFLATRTLGARIDSVRQAQPEVYQHVHRNPNPYDLPEFSQPV